MNPESMAQARRLLGIAASRLVQPNSVVGLGTGDTAAWFIRALADRQQAGLVGVRCVATSVRSDRLGRELGLSMLDVDDLAGGSPKPIALTVDGADEVDPALRLIKGAGGALLFEKIIARASQRLVIVADRGKLVQRLGEKRALPVEINPFGARFTMARLGELPGVLGVSLRTTEGRPLVTDGGHSIADLTLQPGFDAPALEGALKRQVGVVETGLFLEEAAEVLIVDEHGTIEVRQRPPTR